MMPEKHAFRLIDCPAGDGYAVVVKPFGALSEDTGRDDCVPYLLADALREREIPYDAVYPVHRLDRTTEGLMLYALTKDAAAALSRAIADGLLTKTYHAYLTADPSLPPEGTLTDWLFFDRRADKSFVVKEGKSGAKEARLSYAFTDAFDWDGVRVTRAEVTLETGRTHQIRVQFGFRKSPLVGDRKYGSRVTWRSPALFSAALTFPWKGGTRQYRWDESDESKNFR